MGIAGDVFVEIISLDVANQGGSVHVTQLKIGAILLPHVVVMEFVHDDLTEIGDSFPKVDGFVHYNSDLPHLAPHQVLTEHDFRFEAWFYHPLEIRLLICHEIDIPMLADVLHHLPKHGVVHELEEVLLKIALSSCSKLGVELDLWC